MSKLKRMAAAAKEIGKVVAETASDAVETVKDVGGDAIGGIKVKRVTDFARDWLTESKDEFQPTPAEIEELKKKRKGKQNLEEYTDRSGDDGKQING